jgi:hypothetical protein
MSTLPEAILVTCVLALPATVLGCADHAAPAAAAASPTPAASRPAAPAAAAPAASASTAAPSDPVATSGADAGAQGPLEREAAQLDAALRRARDRIDAGGAQVNAAARDELRALEKRYAVVQQQLRDLGKKAEQKADERAATIRKETKTAVDGLRKDLDRLADRLTR